MISPIFTEEYSTPPPKFSLIHKLLFERFFWSFTIDEMKLFWGHQISSSLGSQFPIRRENQFSAGEQVTSRRSDRSTTTHWDVSYLIRFLKQHVKTFWVVYLMRYLHQNVYTVFLAKVFQMPASKNGIQTCWKKNILLKRHVQGYTRIECEWSVHVFRSIPASSNIILQRSQLELVVASKLVVGKK